MKILFIFFLLLIFTAPCYAAKRLYPEAEYQNLWCAIKEGEAEYILNDKIFKTFKKSRIQKRNKNIHDNTGAFNKQNIKTAAGK